MHGWTVSDSVERGKFSEFSSLIAHFSLIIVRGGRCESRINTLLLTDQTKDCLQGTEIRSFGEFLQYKNYWLEVFSFVIKSETYLIGWRKILSCISIISFL